MPQRWDAQGNPISDSVQRWDATGKPIASPASTSTTSSSVDLTKPAFSTDKSGAYQPPVGSLRPKNPARAAAGRELLSQEQQAAIPQGFLRSLGADVSGALPIGESGFSGQSIPSTIESEQAERAASGQSFARRMAAGTGEALGVNIPGIEKSVGAGQMSDAWGHVFAIPALSVMGDYATGKMLKSIRALPDQLKIGQLTFSPKDELHAAAVDRVGQAHLEAQKHLQTGMRTLEALTDAKAQNIENADNINKIPLDARPVRDALVMKKAGPQGVMDSPIVKSAENMIEKASMQPHPSMPNTFIDQGIDKMSFGTLKRLRSRLGGLFNKNMTPSERAVVGAAYDQATDLLAGRAGDLNLAKDWNAYNDEFKRQRVFKENTFNDLMQPSLNDPREWFNKVDVTNNSMLRSWLDEMDAKTNPSGLPDQGAGSAFKKVVKDVKPFVKILNTPEGQAVMGRFKAFFQNPVAALVGAGLGSRLWDALNLPGGKWIGGMAGATQSVELANKLAIAHWLIKGEKFPLGESLMQGTPSLGMATSHTGPSPITVQPNTPPASPTPSPTTPPSPTPSPRDFGPITTPPAAEAGARQRANEISPIAPDEKADLERAVGHKLTDAEAYAERKKALEWYANQRLAKGGVDVAPKESAGLRDRQAKQAKSPAGKVNIDELPPDARARVMKQIRETQKASTMSSGPVGGQDYQSALKGARMREWAKKKGKK